MGRWKPRRVREATALVAVRFRFPSLSCASKIGEVRMSWANWEPCKEDSAATAWDHLVDHAPEAFSGATFIGARSTKLSFYTSHRLIEFHYVAAGGSGRAFLLDGPDGAMWLDGDSGPIHATNELESLALSDATVLDYLQFFLYFIRSDGEGFVLVE